MEPPSDLKERMRESYNAIAPVYNTWTERHHHLRLAYLDELLARLPGLASAKETHRVLELGCGAGKPFLDTLLTRGPNVHAFANDLSDTQIDLARSNLGRFSDRVEFHPGDMTKLELEPGSLTAVVALYSIIHLPQDEQEAMFKRISRWLCPGGVLLVNLADMETPGIVFETWLHEKGWMFWSGLGKDKVVDKLNRFGLKAEKMEVEGDTEEKFLWIIARKAVN